jgi:hypothetical protein
MRGTPGTTSTEYQTDSQAFFRMARCGQHPQQRKTGQQPQQPHCQFLDS